MDSNRRWFGWIAIGLGTLALLVALFGRGSGPQSAGGFGGANMAQAYAQQSAGPQAAGPQNGTSASGANAQQGIGQQRTRPQNSDAAPGANAQQGQARPGNGPQSGWAASGADARHGPGRSSGSDFVLGGWLRFPFKLLGGIAQTAMLALLVLLGVWLLRRRGAAGVAQNNPRPQPAQGSSEEPLSPTGESYTDEANDQV